MREVDEMLRMENKTKLSEAEVIERAVKFFHGEYGLEVKEQTDCLVTFEGGGGGVSVATCVENDKTAVEVTSREWDYQVKDFLSKIS
jgi:hypothetical protein